MRNAAIFLLTAALCVSSAAEAKNKTSNGYTAGSSVLFQPKGFIQNFSTMIPAGTKVLYADDKDETTYSFSVGNAAMRIRVLYSKNPDLISQIQSKKWELRGMDPSIRTIIDGENITIRKTVKGTLLVYQFKDSGKKPVIQRTLITGQDSYIYIIDCRAPVKDFYKYEDAFNILMGCFRITGTDTPAEKTSIQPEQEQTQTEENRKPIIHVDTDELNSMGLKEDTNGETKTDATPLEPEKTVSPSGTEQPKK